MSLSSSSQHADPLVGSVENSINHSDSIPVSRRTRLQLFCDYLIKFIKRYIPVFVIIPFFSLAIYEIIHGCYNCQPENNNLSYMCASCFANIPFVIGVFPISSEGCELTEIRNTLYNTTAVNSSHCPKKAL